MDQFVRTELLIGKQRQEELKTKKVAIFGLGGVGSFAAEALARAGIENFLLVDDDVIDITNINRQLYALHSTIGKDKVEVAKNRILDINPNGKIETKKLFFSEKNEDMINESYSYIIDAIDSVSSKIILISRAIELNIPIISSMGTGNKLDPSQFEITDIEKTAVCPLAKVMRKELRRRGILHTKVLYSKENPVAPIYEIEEIAKRVPASISFVPSVAGLMIAGEVICNLLEIER